VELFHEMGNLVEERWRARGHDERAFPDVAARVLEELQPHRHVGVDAILEHFCGARTLEPQTRDRLAHRLFVLHQGRRFHISALFWIDEIAAPHDHGFWGAFQVLDGARLHYVYRFEERLRESGRFQLGDLRLQATELLARGDVRQVAAGPGFVHALCHVDRPGVSIVVETPAGEAPTMDYHPPHVACAQSDDDPVLLAHLKVLDTLRLVDGDRYRRAACELLAGATLHTTFRVLEHAEERAGGDARAALLAAARARHGGAAELFATTLAEARRRMDTRIRRRLVRDPDHRFLLALLLYSPDRRAVDAMVRARAPAARPAERIGACIEELCLTPAPGGGENVLDLPHDETWLLVLRLLLEGPSHAEVLARLADEFGAEEVAAQERGLRELCAAIRGSPLLRPLFTPDSP
jgi:predicted metal-dependent enzyme (double-stranded beta helix superfamily)